MAGAFGVGWATVMTAVREHGTPLVNDPDRRLDAVAALGVDETAFLAANAAHPTVFVTGIVDISAPRPLDVVEGRGGSSKGAVESV